MFYGVWDEMSELPFNPDKLNTELLDAYDTAPAGLTDEVFTYISTVTPLINVDLLVKNEKGEILLSWRESDKRSGWHIPGGIIRYKETASNRISEVARIELGCVVNHGDEPIKITEIFVPERRRGHTISLLYECRVVGGLDLDAFNMGKSENDDGYLKWFDKCPKVLVYGQRRAYEEFLKNELGAYCI